MHAYIYCICRNFEPTVVLNYYLVEEGKVPKRNSIPLIKFLSEALQEILRSHLLAAATSAIQWGITFVPSIMFVLQRASQGMLICSYTSAHRFLPLATLLIHL